MTPLKEQGKYALLLLINPLIFVFKILSIIPIFILGLLGLLRDRLSKQKTNI